MLDLPKFIHESINKEDFRCMKCSKCFEDSGLSGCGIKVAHEDSNRTVLFVEYMCPHCGARPLLQLQNMGLAHFSELMFEAVVDSEIRSQKPGGNMEEPKPKAKKRNNQSRISKEEQKSASDIINASPTWEDMLHGFGATPDKDLKSFKFLDEEKEPADEP